MRQLALAVHVAVSVIGLGAVSSYVVLSMIPLIHSDPEVIRGAYIAMAQLAGLIILPLVLSGAPLRRRIGCSLAPDDSVDLQAQRLTQYGCRKSVLERRQAR